MVSVYRLVGNEGPSLGDKFLREEVVFCFPKMENGEGRGRGKGLRTCTYPVALSSFPASASSTIALNSFA